MTDQIRVLVVTTNPSLVIGLTFAGQDYDVDSQPELSGAVDADVVVLDVDDVEVHAQLATMGESHPPVLVITEGQLDDLPDGVAVVPRPFTLDDLVDRIDLAVYGEVAAITEEAGAPAASEAAAPAASEAAAPEAAEIDLPAEEAGASDATAVTGRDAPGSDPASDPASDPGFDPASDNGRDVDGGSTGAPGSGSVSPSGAPDTEPDGSTRPSLVSRLFGRMAGSTSTSVPAEEQDADPAAAPVGTMPGEATALSAVDAQERGDVPDPAALRAAGSPQPTPEPAVQTPEPERPAPEREEPAPEPDEPSPPQVRQVVTRPTDDAARSAGPAARSRSRWFARRAPAQDSAQQDLRTRLARTLTAANELERLCEDLPLLRSRHGLVRGIVVDVAQQLDADSVGFWRRPTAGEGWQLVAHQGLSPHASTRIVQPDQPLFHEVESTGGGLLIDPVDALQAAVAGIGGAHTASFMAAAVAVGPGDFGIIAVGRNAPLDGDDLDLLVDIAQEAAPGLAVAEQLERLAELSEADRSTVA